MKTDHLCSPSESKSRKWPSALAHTVCALLLAGAIAFVWAVLQGGLDRNSATVNVQHQRIRAELAADEQSEPNIPASLVANPVALQAHTAAKPLEIEPSPSPWLNTMALSNDRPQDLVFKAIAGHGDKTLKEHYLLSAYSQLPEDLLVNFHLLSLCIEDPSSGACSLPFEKILLAQDGHNVYTLIHLALYRAAMGDYQKAQLYLTRSAWGDVQEDYVLRHLIAVDESYRYHNVTRSLRAVKENLILAVAATVPDYRQLVELCDALAASRGAEGQVWCQLMGKSLKLHSKSLLDQATGGVFERRYAANMSALESAQSIALLRCQALNDHRALENLNFLFERYGNSLIPDLAWMQFLNQYKSQDEVAASLYLIDYITSGPMRYVALR